MKNKNDIIFTHSSREVLDKTAENMVQLLKQKKFHISVAESCTGGMLSELITSVSGASDVYELGICTYSNRMKSKFLSVSNSTLEQFGAVSSQTAFEMVKGLAECSKSDICVAVTGIAGPEGGTPQKPVGTVWLGFYVQGKIYTQQLPIANQEKTDLSRDKIRKATVLYAMMEITDYLHKLTVDYKMI